MVEQNKDQQLKNANVIKVFLMILIVLYHSFLFLNGKWFGAVSIEYHPVPTYICEWVNTFTIYTFTFLSGYIFFYQKNEKGAYSKFGEFLSIKTKRLLIPYFVLLFIWVVPMYFIFFGWNFDVFIHYFILGEAPNQLWFLLMLFLVFVIFWPLSNIFKKKYGLLIALLFFAISIVGDRYIPNYFQIWTTFKFVFFFYLGYITRFKFGGFIKKVPFWLWIIVDISIYVILVFVNRQSGSIFAAISIIVSFILNCIGVFMVWSSFNFIYEKSNIAESKFVSFLSTKTMTIYMIHQQLIYVSIYLLFDKINLYFLGLINFVLSFGIALLISMVVLRFNATRVLFGEKTIEKRVETV